MSGLNNRMKYDPQICTEHRTKYSTADLEYLCTWYKKISSKEIALALGRTQDSVLRKARKLREQGKFEQCRISI